jgi:hypothetical protein
MNVSWAQKAEEHEVSLCKGRMSLMEGTRGVPPLVEFGKNEFLASQPGVSCSTPSLHHSCLHDTARYILGV